MRSAAGDVGRHVRSAAGYVGRSAWRAEKETIAGAYRHACTTRRRGEFLVMPGMMEIASSPPVKGTAGRRSRRSLSSETSVDGDTSTSAAKLEEEPERSLDVVVGDAGAELKPFSMSHLMELSNQRHLMGQLLMHLLLWIGIA
uniref:Uncharacterized protein n=1 Tax=Oryza rufipogon TaxID=4529 RepID=A0A0E0QWY4_ORYRU